MPNPLTPTSAEFNNNTKPEKYDMLKKAIRSNAKYVRLFDVCNERKRNYLMAIIMKEVCDVCDEVFPQIQSEELNDDSGGQIQ